MIAQRIRPPAVAGYYYPADPLRLAQEVDRLARAASPPSPAIGLIVPHGSYRHAGEVLGETLAATVIPRRCFLLGPSHTGNRMPWSLMGAGAYRTPLGEVPIDEESAEALRRRCPFLEPDAWAQRGEHALEVIVPFLQRLGPEDLSIVPIIMGADEEIQFAPMAQALAQVVRMMEEPVLLIASSDLSHYEPLQRLVVRDRALIEAMEALDGPLLAERVREEASLMCGYGAVACVLEAARFLGAARARLVRYAASPEKGGDPDSAIGYAGLSVGSEAQ